MPEQIDKEIVATAFKITHYITSPCGVSLLLTLDLPASTSSPFCVIIMIYPIHVCDITINIYHKTFKVTMTKLSCKYITLFIHRRNLLNTNVHSKLRFCHCRKIPASKASWWLSVLYNKLLQLQCAVHGPSAKTNFALSWSRQNSISILQPETGPCTCQTLWSTDSALGPTHRHKHMATHDGVRVWPKTDDDDEFKHNKLLKRSISTKWGTNCYKFKHSYCIPTQQIAIGLDLV